MKKEEQRKFFWFIVIIILIVVIGAVLYAKYKPKPVVLPALTHTVTRSFPSGTLYTTQEITVSLAVSDTAGDNVYAIEEIIPAGAIFVLDSTDGTYSESGGIKRIRWLVKQPDVVDTVKTYKVTFSAPGPYSFSGTYAFNDETTASVIAGPTQLIIEPAQCTPADVTNCPDDGNDCTNTICSNFVCGTEFNTDPCNDGKYCTVGDICSSGSCTSGLSNICPDDSSGDGCVDTGEIAGYVSLWLNDQLPGIGVVEITNTANLWVTGISACPP